MHHALHLQELLLDIFGHWYPLGRTDDLVEWRRYTTDLAALARTCKTFKEPALNLLWLELIDLSPLARCLPNSCRSSGTRYSISRPLDEAEWNTLRSYTRRVWFIHGFSTDFGLLDDESIRTVFNPPSADPLFPNLRSLYWQDITRFPVVHLTSPLLTSLTLHAHFYPGGGCLSRHFLDTAADFCPNIKQLRIYMSRPHPLDETISHHICRWMGLEIVECPMVALNADAISHLSSMPTLTWLSFTLNAEPAAHISDLGSTCVFSNLEHMEISSVSIESITRLLPNIRLPVTHTLVVKVGSSPSEETVQAFTTLIRNACPADTLANFELLETGDQIRSHVSLAQQQHRELTLHAVRPCTAFSNLLGIHINLKWSVSLTDDNLISLVSATPHIESLVINDVWGWRTEIGITLFGLLMLLWSCPSLYDICLALATPTYTAVPVELDVGFPQREGLRINVVDSYITAEDVPALVSAFKQLELWPAELLAWSGADMPAGARVYRSLWEDVYNQLMQEDAEEPPAGASDADAE